MKEINLNSERSKSSDVLLPCDLLQFFTFDYSPFKHSEGLLFYFYLLVSFGVKLYSRFGEMAELKWKDISFGSFSNPDDPSQITEFIKVFFKNRKTDYSKHGVVRKFYPSYGSQEAPYCAYKFFHRWFKMVKNILGGVVDSNMFVFSNYSCRSAVGVVYFIFTER